MMKTISENILSLLVLLVAVTRLMGSDTLSIHTHTEGHYAHDITFVENKGQWNKEVLFKANIPGGFFYLDKSFTLTYYFYDTKQYDEYQHHLKFLNQGEMNYHVIKVDFPACNPLATIIKEEKGTTSYNYFHGRDKSKWVGGVKGFKKIVLKNIYPGVNLELMSFGGMIKYNFIVSPFTDPGVINIRYSGVQSIALDGDKLTVTTSVNEFYELLPEVYILKGDLKEIKECQFELQGNLVSFKFPDDGIFTGQLVIDPVIIFSTYSGSWADNFGYTATYDDSGYAYSGGTVFFDSFPVTAGAFQKHWADGLAGNNPSSGGARDIGILKYSPDGTQLIYATYLGGSGNEDPHSMVVNSQYELIVFGNTNSSDFPMDSNFYDSSYNGNFDIFLAKFSTNGNKLLASTYIGGSGEDGINGYFTPPSYTNQSSLGHNYGDIYRGEVNIGTGDTVFVITTTKSTDFPYTTNAYQKNYGGGIQDACVIKLNPSLTSLEAATFLGGSLDDAGYGIAFHSDGSVFLCGGTKSTDLTMPGGKYLDSFQGGNADGFIYHLDAGLSRRISATYIGTVKYDQTYFVQTDDNDHVYVTGQTKNPNFPIVHAKYFNYSGSQFIMKLNEGLDSILYSTVFGSGRTDPDLSPSAFLVDHCERVYFSGWGGLTNHTNNFAAGVYDSWNWGSTDNLPLKNANYTYTDGSDFYIAVFARNMEGLLYATYYGDPNSADHVDGGTSRFDKNSIIYQSVCAGCNTTLSTFPTTTNAWSTQKKGHRPPNSSGYYSPTGCNNAVFKIDLDIPDLLADFDVDTLFCLRDSTRITNKTVGGLYYFWDFGDGDTSSGFEPKHAFKDTGIYTITLITTNLLTCDQYDTIDKNIVVMDAVQAGFKATPQKCKNDIYFSALSTYASSFYWDFGDTQSVNNIDSTKNANHVFQDTGIYYVTLITDSGTICESKTIQAVRISDLPKANFNFTLDTCRGKTVFKDSSLNTSSWLWYFGDQDTAMVQNPVHYYLKADTFVIIQIAEPNSVCADTSQQSLIIETPKADIVVELDTCLQQARFINPTKYVRNMSVWIGAVGDTTWFKDTIIKKYVAGTYTITLVANLTTICVDTIQRRLVIPPLPEADFSKSHTPCDSFVYFKNLSQNASFFTWDFGNQANSQLVSPDSVKYATRGQYIIRLTARSDYNCVDTLRDTLKIRNFAKAAFNYNSILCETRVTLDNISSNPGQYNWDFGNGLSDTNYQPGQVDYDSAGQYQVQLIVTDGVCVDTTSRNLVLYAPPQIDFESLSDSCSPLAEFTSQLNGVIDNRIVWTFDDSTSSHDKDPVHQFPAPGKYKVRLLINYDTVCTSFVEKEVDALTYDVTEIIIPNVFTPNADNTNDLFKIGGLNFSCDSYKLYIYNRWGQPVFKSKGNKLTWDGRYKGIMVSEGVYYYVLKGNNFDQAGTVTVIYTSTQ